MKIGDRIRLLEDVTLFGTIFSKGHEFTIYNESYRGYDLIDDNLKKMDETALINNKLEFVREQFPVFMEERDSWSYPKFINIRFFNTAEEGSKFIEDYNKEYNNKDITPEYYIRPIKGWK